MKQYNNSAHGDGFSRELIRGSALRMAGRRDFCEAEFYQKLCKKFPGAEKIVGELVQEFMEQGWISDSRFAEEFIREKVLYSGWGPLKIIQKLKERGLAIEIIEKYLAEEFPKELQRERAGELARKKWKSFDKKNTAERTAAVQRFLVSRGFEFSTVLDVTRDL